MLNRIKFSKKKLLTTLLNVIIVIVFLVVLIPILPLKNVPKFYAVVSGSMEPTIKTGALAYTIPIKPSDVKVNDIVVFTSPYNNKEVILHRIIEVTNKDSLRFVTKGDKNVSRDAWDLMDVGILGKYSFSIPYVGYLTAFVRKPLGFILLVVLPALYLIILQILSIKKAIQEEVDKKIIEAVNKGGDFTSHVTHFVLLLSISLMFTIYSAKAVYNDKISVTGLVIETSHNDKDYPTDCDKEDKKDDNNDNRCKDKDKDKKKDLTTPNLLMSASLSILETTPSETAISTETTQSQNN